MSLLSIHNLSFRYADARLFAGASFQINPGDRIGLVGANGSGKTTLLRILAGELPPDTGEIVRRRGLRVGALWQAEERDAVSSSGERVREALGRCLSAQPDLLLDEPTSHLDIETREWLEDRLAGLRAAWIVISHDRVFLNRVTERTLRSPAAPCKFTRAITSSTVTSARSTNARRGNATRPASAALPPPRPLP